MTLQKISYLASAVLTLLHLKCETSTEMGDKGGNRSGSGRPKLSSLKDIPASRGKYQCPVCGTEKRSDKLQDHLQQLCHFDTDGKPIDSSFAQYSKLSSEARQHTDYCASKDIKKDELNQCWKRLSPSEHGSNPFEVMKKRHPSGQLCQSMNFATTSDNSSSRDQNAENIVSSASDIPDIPLMDHTNPPDSHPPNPGVSDALFPPNVEPPNEHHGAAATSATFEENQFSASGSGE